MKNPARGRQGKHGGGKQFLFIRMPANAGSFFIKVPSC